MHEGRLRKSGHLEHRWRQVDDVVELVTRLPACRDPAGPVHDRAVAGPAPVRGDLLGPLVRRVHRMGPSNREVVVRRGSAELLDPRRHELWRFQGSRAVHADEFVERAVDGAFGGGSVVADHGEDQGVV
jgi:hypothetical protein